MSHRRKTSTCYFLVALTAASSSGAAAQLPPAVSPAVDAASEPAEAPPSDAERAAFEAALAADAAQTSPNAPLDNPAGNVGRAQAMQSMNPELSVLVDLAAAYFSRAENLQGGAHDPQSRGFNLQQLELAIGSAVDPYFRFDANLVFALDGVEIEEAYATTLSLPFHLQARAGQFLTRFGRLNPTHPHSWDFVDQPFALTRLFGGEGNRGLGFELSWLAPLPWYAELVGSATQLGGSGTARSFLGDEDLAVRGLDDFEYVTALKQFFPFGSDWSLAVGISGAFGPNSSGRDGGSQLYGTDVYLKWRPITTQSYQFVALHAEWFYRRRQAAEGALHDTDGFAALSWRFAQRWSTAVRYEFGSPALDADLSPSADDLDPDWTRSRHRVSASGTFLPTEFSRIRLQGALDRPGWQDEPTWALFLVLGIVTGAHGAHAF